ncbi:MAG: hypothetical protein IKJ44_05520 [Elusimicrobiaceae bacterium]|nr:hypothetical protein [Elusimicrobiaceae bacterium]
MNINRLIYPGFWFGKTKTEEALELSARGVGGFCIYGGSSKKEVQDLIASLRAVSPLKHLFICADYEDGLGRWIEGESWVLSNMAVGASGQAEIAYQKGLTLAQEARQIGVDWVFAPVLDLCDEPQNPIVNTRSFGANPALAAQMGTALCQGLKDGGVLNSIKHFPGHGHTTQDSHLALPSLARTLEQLQKNELIPFQKALPVADSVMIGHLLLPSLDPVNPASLSPFVITDLLKKQLGFNKLIFTDALCMKAIGDEKQAALQALRAGAHILLAAENSLALSDFLQTQTGLDAFARESARLQDNAFFSLPAQPKQGLSAAAFNQRYVSLCAVQQGDSASIKPGMRVAYEELGNEENLAGGPFVRALEEAGVCLVSSQEKADILIAVSFSNYKAFKGHINLSAREKEKLATLCKFYPQSIFVSFGSPFGTEEIQALNSRLYLFSPAREAQICAANILLKKQKPEGKIPFGPIE